MKISKSTIDAIKLGSGLAATAIGAVSDIIGQRNASNISQVLAGVERVVELFADGVAGRIDEAECEAGIRAAADDLDARMDKELRDELEKKHAPK